MKKILLLTVVCLPLLVTKLAAQGFYVEYKMSTVAGSAQSVSGSMKLLSQDGNSRSAIEMNSPMGGINIVSLSLKATPDKVYLLDEKAKTYSEFPVDTKEEWTDNASVQYTVEVVGKEKVNGYNSTHVKVSINGRQREDLWTTKEIDGYADFSKIKSKYTGKDNLYKALAAKSAEGMPVRILVKENNQSVQMDLVKAERRNNPASLFSISGYSKGSGIPGMPAGMPDMQEMMKQLQNATPEEREEILRRLKEMYQDAAPHH